MTIKQVFNTSADLDYPNVLPTLDLNFANTKTLDSRITFTRSSGGSYTGSDGLIKYAGVNEARFDHDPITGESLGLLIEESRENLIINSSTFLNTPFNATIAIDNSVSSPDGSFGVQKLTAVVDSGFAYSQCAFTSNSTGSTKDYVWSVFVKKGNPSLDRLNIQFGGTNTGIIVYYFSTDTIINISATSFGRTLYPNGWVRLYGSTSMLNGDTFNLLVIIADIQAAGGSGSYCYQWGAQIEQGSFPTSYIPTVGSTRTRGSELASISGTNFSNFYNQTEGTFNFSTRISKINTSVGQVILGVAERLIFNESIYISNDSGRNDITGIIIDGGVNQATFFSSVTITSGSFNKISLSYKKNDSAGSINSSNPQIDNNCTLPTVNTLKIGSAPWALTAATPFSGTIANITYFPKRLPNSQLKSLST